MGNTGELQVWALLFTTKSCHLRCKCWCEVCAAPPGRAEMQLTVGAAHGDVAQLCDMMCAKAIPTPQSSKPHIWGLEQLQSCTRFYLLGSACWSLLRFWNAFDHLRIFSFGALSPVAPDMNQLLHVVKKKNQKCTFLFPFAYLRDSTDELSAKPESCAWLILKCQGFMEMSVFALFFSDTVL